MQAEAGAPLTDQAAGQNGAVPDQNAVDTTPRARRRVLFVLALAVLVVALDQISKALVVARLTGHNPVRILGGAIYLVEERNRGAAFNLAEGMTIVLTVIAAVVVVVIVRVAARLTSTAWAVALGLVLGGATGNLCDRLVRGPGPLRGAVVDWISLFDSAGQVWPVFNLADSAIVCGGAIAVVLMLLGKELTVRNDRT